MNNKTTYELKITDKLQELPLPDLQDAIWSRIERTLDIDMPTDDGGGDSGPDTPSPFGGGGATGVGSFMFSLFFVAAVTAFIIFKSTDKTPEQGPAPDNTPAFELRAPSNTNQQPPPGATALPPNNAPVRTTDPGTAAGDSVLGQPLVATPPPVSVDTATGNLNTALVQQPPLSNVQTPVDTTGVKKRPRGVPVNPNDYRIVPKKDSTRQ